MKKACYCPARKRKLNGQMNKVVNKYTSYSTMHYQIINADEEIVLVMGGGEVAHY